MQRILCETKGKPRPPDTVFTNLALGRPGAQPRAQRFSTVFEGLAVAAANSLRNLKEMQWFCEAGIANLKIAENRPSFLARLSLKIYNVQIENWGNPINLIERN